MSDYRHCYYDLPKGYDLPLIAFDIMHIHGVYRTTG